MIRLFTRFDIFFRAAPFASILFIFIATFSINIYKSNFNKNTLHLIKIKIGDSFVSTKKRKNNKFLIMIINSLFFILLMLNVISIFSFNFPFRTQLSMLIGLSLVIWVSFIIFNLKNSIKYFLSHCIPEGTPIYLVWFLFMIELIRNSIRPITVSVRMVANITAGHLLIILLAKLVENYPLIGLAYLLLNFVELIVAIIQSYIFVTMISLYHSEIN